MTSGLTEAASEPGVGIGGAGVFGSSKPPTRAGARTTGVAAGGVSRESAGVCIESTVMASRVACETAA